MAGGLVTSRRQGDSFVGPGGHSANLEAQRSFLRGSWSICSSSLSFLVMIFNMFFFLVGFQYFLVSKG